MNEILDEGLDRKENRGYVYADAAYAKFKTAFIFFILTILISILSRMMLVPYNIRFYVTSFFFVVSFIYAIIALVPAIQSYKIAEKDTFNKWSSLIGGFFIVFVFSYKMIVYMIDYITYLR